jgi:hypothetical protein
MKDIQQLGKVNRVLVGTEALKSDARNVLLC